MYKDQKNIAVVFFAAVGLIVIMLITTIVNIVKISNNLKANEKIEVVNELEENTQNISNNVLGDE